MKVSEAQLRMVERELHRMAELSAAIAADASFLVFTLLMSGDEPSPSPGEIQLELPTPTVDALRAVCRTVTGVDGATLDDEALLQVLADATVRQENLGRAAHALACMTERSRGSRGRSGARRT